MESLAVNRSFWRGKSVFLTGHTGFKGGWLAVWLHSMGARVVGYALQPRKGKCLFNIAGVAQCMEQSIVSDIRDSDALRKAIAEARPEIVVHMAAQALVRESYIDPAGTYATNVMGTVNVLETARTVDSIRVVAVVTSDKCYENREWLWGYRENDPMGGHDPYSSSKGCAELVSSAYLRSFFGRANPPIALVSLRAGNVIGGGDWSDDRIIPDAIRSFHAGVALNVRNPDAVRPWQHVLEPLGGYLRLIERAWGEPARYCGGWNFGPEQDDTWPVGRLVDELCKKWPGEAKWSKDAGTHPHEAGLLRLDCSKARTLLQWKPRLALSEALDWTVDWYVSEGRGEDMLHKTREQIERYDRRVME